MSDLIFSLNDLKELKRIRYTTSHPKDVTKDLIEAHRDCEKLMPILHLPVQSGSSKVLKAMNRKHNTEEYNDIIANLKKAKPNIKFSSDFIIGYPGETEDDFESLSDFVREMEFDRLGVFTYSEEEGTTAEVLDDNIPREVKDYRKNQILEIQHDISLDKNEAFVGKTLKVLVDEVGEKVSIGRTEYDSPEIDNIVHVKGNAEKGTFVNVKIEEVNEYELIGHVV